MTKETKISWKKALFEAFTKPKDLLDYLELDLSQLSETELAHADFAFKVPRGFASRMQKGNIADPLLRQVLPVGAELIANSDYSTDPLLEGNSNPIPGLLHKYQNRVLFITSTACAINCRYCFRRHFPYDDNNPGSLGWDKALSYIANDPSIEEVILSGGDPLVINDNQLEYLINKIETIPHVSTLRIHTRLPIVLPERITLEFINILQRSRLQIILVVHSNHGNEIDDAVRAALNGLKLAGITLLNQAVLLRGINDNLTAQIQLHKTLFQAGVLPYYLHLLDKVQGAAHFNVPEAEAIELMQQLQKHLPGYLLPKLAKEVPGQSSKSIIRF